MKKKNKVEDNVVAQNKKARHDYEILDTVEAGIELTGTEIKSIRNHRVNLRDGFARVRNGEMWLEEVDISPYENGNQFNHDPRRNRKLLLHRKEITKLGQTASQTGITLVPLKMYIKNGFAKVLIGMAKGRHTYDKRQALKQQDQDRQIRRELSNRLR